MYSTADEERIPVFAARIETFHLLLAAMADILPKIVNIFKSNEMESRWQFKEVRLNVLQQNCLMFYT